MPKNTHISKKHVAHLEQVRRQTRAIQIGAIILIALVVGLVGYGIITDTVLKPYRPVASVNGEWVTVRDFQTYAKFQRLQLISQINQYLQYAQMFGISDPINDQNFVGPVLQQAYSQLISTEQMGQKVLDAKIDDLLIRQEVKKRNIVVSTVEVEKGMQERLGYYASGTPTPEPTLVVPALPTLNQTQVALVSITPTPVPPTSTPAESPTPTVTATLDPSITPTVTPSPTTTPTVAPSFTPGPTATITPTATPYTLEGYNTALKTELEFVATNADIEESDYRKLFESDAYREKLKEVIVADLKPVQAQVWARHILVDTEEEAKQVLERLNKGEDFGKVAAEVSKDTGSGANGGDLGWFSQGTMVKEFQDVAFTMKVGEISQPVKSEFGYHIIQVLGHEDRPLSTDDFQKFKEQTFTDFLKKLREDSKVETYDLWKEVVPTEPALPPQLEQMLQPQQQPGGLPLQP